ncbi:MAG: hypothetical protein R3F30_15455 [Planctomycetota bacterium]
MRVSATVERPRSGRRPATGTFVTGLALLLAAGPPTGGDCRGCAVERRREPGWSGGVEVKLPEDGPASVVAAGILAEAGRCRIHGRCFVWRDCRWTVWALIANGGDGEVVFDAGPDYVALPIPGLVGPDDKGRVRIPKGRMALYLAGPRPLPCDGAWMYRSLGLRDGGQAWAGTLRWSARCSRCTDDAKLPSGVAPAGRPEDDPGRPVPPSSPPTPRGPPWSDPGPSSGARR